MEGFTKVVSNNEIKETDSNLSILLCIRHNNDGNNDDNDHSTVTLEQAIADW